MCRRSCCRRSLSGIAYLAMVLGMTFTLLSMYMSIPAKAASSFIIVQITGASQPPGFLPSLVTIHSGDVVDFVNNATPTASYTIMANDGSFSSPAIASKQQWSNTFTHVGTYEYYAVGSSQHMVGEIVVVPVSVKLLSTPAPSAQATAIAAIRANKQPPPLPTTVPSTLTVSNNGLNIMGNKTVEIALLGGLALLILAIVIVLLALNRRRHHHSK